MTVPDIIARLESLTDSSAAAGMARYGITGAVVYGIRIPVLRAYAKEIGRDHLRALDLWQVPGRETRILAAMTDEPDQVNEAQMEQWVRDFDSWEVTDQTIMCDFEKTPLAWDKASEWSAREPEFEKRAGFVLMARLAVSDKRAPDRAFELFFPIMLREAEDNRNFVKKAVNWALRQTGKRNRRLHRQALDVAREMQAMSAKSARWIAADAIRKLTDEKIVARIKP